MAERRRVLPPAAGIRMSPAPHRDSSPAVFSASRRIDLPACFPRELAARIREIGPENIHTLVLWTKDPRTMLTVPGLRDALREIESLYLHLTVTGMGGTAVEPGVPSWRMVLDDVPRLLQRLPGLKGEGIELRYDPLMAFRTRGSETSGNLDAGLFRRIASAAATRGVTKVRTSVMTPYPKVLRRLASAGIAILPDMEEEARRFLREVMEPACGKLGLAFLTCAKPDRGDPGCIDGGVLTRLHPRGLPASLARDASQRPACRCTRSRDIGGYFSCPHGCLYCYGNPVTREASKAR